MGSASDETAAAAAAAAAGEGVPAGEAGPDSKDLQQQSKALDKLTDHVEDRQLDSSRVQSVRLSRTPIPRSYRFAYSGASFLRIRFGSTMHWLVSKHIGATSWKITILV
jgi:hypothetical protein